MAVKTIVTFETIERKNPHHKDGKLVWEVYKDYIPVTYPGLTAEQALEKARTADIALGREIKAEEIHYRTNMDRLLGLRKQWERNIPEYRVVKEGGWYYVQALRSYLWGFIRRWEYQEERSGDFTTLIKRDKLVSAKRAITKLKVNKILDTDAATKRVIWLDQERGNHWG